MANAYPLRMSTWLIGKILEKEKKNHMDAIRFCLVTLVYNYDKYKTFGK